MGARLVQLSRNDITKKFVAFLLIVALTMVDFALLGAEAISYAADAISEGTATNNKNVTFDSYFKDEGGAVVSSREESINSTGIKLFMRVAVRNDGYFNGTISLGNSNFKFKNEISNDIVNKIEGNTITLNQINGGEAVEFEVGIEPLKDDTISSGLLTMSSDISINGTYKDSSEREKEIKATRQVQLVLASPYADNEGIEFTSNIITNKVYKINEENKRIVQVLFESGLKGNEYPVKETNMEISVPNGVEKVEVISRGMLSTNGKSETEFNTNNWTYSENDKKINVTIKNQEENGTIKWAKNGKDKIVVTYIMPENTNITGTDITAKSTISMYDTKGTVKEANTTSKVSEEKDGVITTGVEISENSIYKGKIYSGENRNYNVTTNIYVNNSETGKAASVEAITAAYQTAAGEILANAQYINTTISKAEVVRVLGEDGTLTILTDTGTQVAQITNESETDENGNIVINYPEGTTALRIETSSAVQAGTISLNSTKTIKQDGNSRDVQRTYTALKETITGAEARIKLDETETKAELNISKASLSTLAKNENVEITATLITNGEKYDLYRNPVFEITLPQSIKSMDVKSVKTIYADMFNVAAAEIQGNTITIVLDGEQTNYSNIVNQTTILITADIEFDMLTPSENSAITMNYTNENGVQGTYSTSKNVSIESKYGLMMYSEMSGYNEAGDRLSTMDDEVAKGSLDLDSGSKIATVKDVVINNNDEAMQNVSIIGRIPTSGLKDGTINTELANVNISLEGVTVLYSTNENANANDDSWKEDSQGAKSFKINMPELQKGDKVETEYSFVIPQEIGYGESLYSEVDTQYTYLGNEMAQASTVGAETPKLTGMSAATLQESVATDLENGIKTNIGTTTAGRELKDGESIYEGQAIEYTVQITNNTGKDLKNVNVSIAQENGTMYGLKELEVFMTPMYSEGEDLKIEHAYRELDTNAKELETIENFENGKTIQFKYEIVANQVEGEAKTQGEIKIKADSFDETKVKTISNKIEQAELKLNYVYRLNEEVQLYYGQTPETILNIENISEKDLKDVKATVRLPEGTYCEGEFYMVEATSGVNITNVSYHQEDNTVTFEIPEIKSGKKTFIQFATKAKEFTQSDRNLVFMAEANTKEGKTYYSNVMARNMKNIEKEIYISQEANVGDETALKNGDEFTLTITAKNDTDKDFKATISDELPDGFTVTDAYAEFANKTEQLEIVEYDGEEDVNAQNNNYVLNNTLMGNCEFTFDETIPANSQIRITLNIKLNTYSSEDKVTNTAKLIYVEENNLYEAEKESQKTFILQPLEVSDTINYVEVVQDSNVKNKSTITNGQEIIYTTKIKNISNENVEISINDVLPSGIIAKQVTLNGQSVTESVLDDNELTLDDYELGVGQETEIKILANYSEDNTAEQELSNIVSVITPEDTVSSNAITYYASRTASDGEEDDDDNPGGNGSGENGSGGNTSSNYTISGVAWLDENKNGQRESSEKLLKGIQVKVIDSETGNFMKNGENDMSTVTSDSGYYSFDLQRGNYVVVFMYDSNQYALTQYQKDGVPSTNNSDVIAKELNNAEIASTDNIKLVSENADNIDIGLLENTKFDFELNKNISEITVRTSKGVNTYTYDNATLSKVEIHAKELNNANVIIKYKMRVTNNGEIAGYVKDIADYMPTSLTFNSELNTDWYQTDKNLHNTSLQNTKINAGETKEITLTLTKTMTESNTGLISNTAELSDVYNELGVSDLDSTPGNKNQSEDDFGKADVIIGVKTGALVTYVGLVMTMLVTIGVGAYIINRRVLKNDKIDELEL